MSDIFPVNPNAPKINHELYMTRHLNKYGHEIMIIGGPKPHWAELSVAELCAQMAKHPDIVVYVGKDSELPERGINIENLPFHRKPEIFEIKPSPMIDMPFIDYKAHSHKISPREQRNREKFNKRRK